MQHLKKRLLFFFACSSTLILPFHNLAELLHLLISYIHIYDALYVKSAVIKSQSVHLHAHSFSSFCSDSKERSIPIYAAFFPPCLMKMNAPRLSQFTSSCARVQITFVRETQQGLVGPSGPERVQW